MDERRENEARRLPYNGITLRNYPAEKKTYYPVGEWNTSRIVAQGNRVEHWLNGEMVVACERGRDDFRDRVSKSKFDVHEKFGEADKGHILIQDHGSEMVFRNMRIRELPANR